ncbi:MAG: rubredoxin [Methanoregula sp.]|uniref:rubredoxin n=2 Tax=Methanoregula sp. TaxID=2052170 RepID=UPI003BB1CB4F
MEIHYFEAIPMDTYRCMMCGHIYDPAKGEPKAFQTILCNFEHMDDYQCKPGAEMSVKAGTSFSALPGDWKCPTCGHPKSYYQKVVPDTLASMRTVSY